MTESSGCRPGQVIRDAAKHDKLVVFVGAGAFKKNPAAIRDRMACLPDFPKAHRLPTSRGRSQRTYNALEVIDCVKSYREKN